MCVRQSLVTLWGFFWGGEKRGEGIWPILCFGAKRRGKKKSDPPQPQLKTRFEFGGLHLFIF